MTPEQIAHKIAGDWVMGPIDVGDLERRIADAVRPLVAACQAELDFYDWHMHAVPSHVLDELVARREALHAQIRAALEGHPTAAQ